MDPAWIAASCALIGLLIGGAAWGLRHGFAFISTVSSFLTDWNGHPGDAGHQPRPGVLERIVRVENSLIDVQAQVHMNGGGSLRDEIKRTEANVAAITDQVTAVQATVDELKSRP